MKERTLSIIKPDGVERGLVGEVTRRFEQAGFRLVAVKMVYLSREQAEGFYHVHRGRSYFEGLIDFMISGPSVAMVLEGEDVIARSRELMGATDPKNAAEGTIRRDFATDGRRNVVHGSDAPDAAAFEIGYFFNALEVIRT
ncbi:MAG: nucleoside-diphosphate kinase [Thermodesulfobacteriota bacterium]|nr:nucleoside-diphosphate kinase [Thermodesulfobacteriota bacterium]